MHTRAKFYISGLTLLPGQPGVKVNLQAVGRGDRNAGWAQATPCGSIEMTVNNPEAARAWEDFMQASRATGRSPELYVDLRPSEDGWPGDGHAFRLGEVPEGHYGYGACGECGMGKDAELTKWDEVLRKQVPDALAHPNG